MDSLYYIPYPFERWNKLTSMFQSVDKNDPVGINALDPVDSFFHHGEICPFINISGFVDQVEA
jgi:hypothetical protein